MEFIKAHPCQGFKVSPFYSKEGGFVSVYWKSDRCCAETLTREIVLYRSVETNEPVGVQIWGIRSLLFKSPEEMARRFHETYERLAPLFGYETRKESAVPWKHEPEKNKALMIAVCNDVLMGS